MPAHPGILLWVSSALGAVLTGDGTILLAYGLFDAAGRRWRS